MTEQSMDDQHARARLVELGVLPSGAANRDPRWTETLNVPVSPNTSEVLQWLSETAGTGRDVLAAKVVEISLMKASLEVSKAAQCAREGPDSLPPRYYAPLVGALRHGYNESKLEAKLSSFEAKDWREIISDAANPSNKALDVLAEFAGFADRGDFVVHLLQLSNLSSQARSSITEQISEHRRAMRFLDTIEGAAY